MKSYSFSLLKVRWLAFSFTLKHIHTCMCVHAHGTCVHTHTHTHTIWVTFNTDILWAGVKLYTHPLSHPSHRRSSCSLLWSRHTCTHWVVLLPAMLLQKNSRSGIYSLRGPLIQALHARSGPSFTAEGVTHIPHSRLSLVAHRQWFDQRHTPRENLMTFFTLLPVHVLTKSPSQRIPLQLNWTPLWCWTWYDPQGKCLHSVCKDNC